MLRKCFISLCPWIASILIWYVVVLLFGVLFFLWGWGGGVGRGWWLVFDIINAKRGWGGGEEGQVKGILASLENSNIEYCKIKKIGIGTLPSGKQNYFPLCENIWIRAWCPKSYWSFMARFIAQFQRLCL